MNPQDRHSHYIDEIRQRYLFEGYQELPGDSVSKALPVPYQPDLVFSRGDDVFVIEVKSGTGPSYARLIRQVRDAVESHKNWHFLLMLVPKSAGRLQVVDNFDDARHFLELASTLRQKHPEAAAMLAWAGLEACMIRLLALHQEPAEPGTPPLTLARRLRDHGELDDDDLEVLATAFRARNFAAHGWRIAEGIDFPDSAYDIAEHLCNLAQESPSFRP